MRADKGVPELVGVRVVTAGMAAYFNSGYPGVSKELLATASDISFCLVFQKLLLYCEVKRSTHKSSKLRIVIL